MDSMIDLLSSDGSRSSMHNLSVVCLVFAIGVTIVGLSFYGRGRERVEAADAHWVMLFAT